MNKKVRFLLLISATLIAGCTSGKVKKQLKQIISAEIANKGIRNKYPLNNTEFPPEFPSPTFEWADSLITDGKWYVFITDSIGSIQISDVTEMNSWKPDSAMWEELKTVSKSKNLLFSSIGVDKDNNITSWSHSKFMISKDSVGADIFFRAVTLPFSYAVKNVHTIEWYMGSVNGGKPHKLLDNMPVCANCHSFSKQDPILAMDVDYANDKGSYTISTIKDTTLLEKQDIISWSNIKRDDNEPTFGLLSQISPDGKYVLSTVKDLSVFVAVDKNIEYSQLFFPIKGIIGIYDRENKVFSELPGANNSKLVQSNPSWSADGQNVVFARTTAYVSERVARAGRALLHPKDVEEFTSGSKQFKYDLYSIKFNDGKGAEAIPLKGASENGKSNYFAKFSPDGKWIVYCQANNFMLLQPDSKLYIIPSQGGEARLMNCNMSNMNSWHSWSPNGKWIVFSSKNRGPYTQLYLTHIDENGNDSPPVLLENLVFNERAANIPEFFPHNTKNFKKIKDNFSQTAQYYTDIASDNIENKYYLRALKNLQKAIETDSNYLEAYFKRITLNALLLQSNSKIDRKDKAKAKSLVEDLIKKNPNNESLLLLKATLLSNMGKSSEALAEANNIIAKFPNSYKTYELICSIYRKTKQHGKTIPMYQKMMSLKPEYKANLLDLIGQAYEEQGQLQLALNFNEQQSKLNSNDINIRYAKIKLLLNLKQFEQAKTHIDFISKNDTANYLSYQLLANYNALINNKIGYNRNIEKALKLINEAIAKNNENIDLLFYKCDLLLNTQLPQEAENEYNHILAILPNNYEALKQLAKIKLGQQQWNEAIAIYSNLINNYPEEEEFYNNSALSYIQLNNAKNALEYFNKALKLNPYNTDTQFNKIRLLNMTGNRTQADKEKQELIKVLKEKKIRKQFTKNDEEIEKLLN